MANSEHVEKLVQGSNVWNQWRAENHIAVPDLRDADLKGLVLDNSNLSNADISRANLEGTSLSFAKLDGAKLNDVNLKHSKLNSANLNWTILSSAILFNTDFSECQMGFTILADLDLRQVIGLETVRHWGNSHISADTLYKSQGQIPRVFLEECGVPGVMIDYIPSLVTAMKPIQFHSVFISYSSKDEKFAQKLYSDLKTKGVRVWFAPESLKIGDKFEAKIDRAISTYDKLLLILSENSVKSDWVEYESHRALTEEQRRSPDVKDVDINPVLFPIRIDNSIFEIEKQWAWAIKKARHIGDFSDWKNHSNYQKAFNRLLRDLGSEE